MHFVASYFQHKRILYKKLCLLTCFLNEAIKPFNSVVLHHNNLALAQN